MQWLRRGAETCLRDAWPDGDPELFLCAERHVLPARILTARCEVHWTRFDRGHVDTGQLARDGEYFCCMAYEAERAAFVDLPGATAAEPDDAVAGSSPDGGRRAGMNFDLQQPFRHAHRRKQSDGVPPQAV